MAKITFGGLAEYEKLLGKLDTARAGIMKVAVYEGADEVADAIRESIKGLPTVKTSEAVADWREQTPVSGVTQKQKDGLLSGLYLTKMVEAENGVYTQVGFTGYNDVKTKGYPDGQPNAMIARAVESGSSARKKTPFVRPAVNRTRDMAVRRMADKLDEQINKLMEGK